MSILRFQVRSLPLGYSIFPVNELPPAAQDQFGYRLFLRKSLSLIELKNTENIRNEIKLGQYIIIPNHLHAIIIINREKRGHTYFLFAGLFPSLLDMY